MSELEEFGKLVAEDLRDGALNRYLDIESGQIGSERSKMLSAGLNELTEGERSLVRELLTECVTTGIHDFLFAIEEKRNGIQVVVNGINIVDQSDGLQGEMFSEDGWFEKFSQHKEKGL